MLLGLIGAATIHDSTEAAGIIPKAKRESERRRVRRKETVTNLLRADAGSGRERREDNGDGAQGVWRGKWGGMRGGDAVINYLCHVHRKKNGWVGCAALYRSVLGRRRRLQADIENRALAVAIEDLLGGVALRLAGAVARLRAACGERSGGGGRGRLGHRATGGSGGAGLCRRCCRRC